MQRRLILVVEDDAAIRRGIVDALRFEGYQTQEAGTAAEGVDQAIGLDCDLVLLDLVLPGGDGLDVLRKVREVRPTLPVIVLTARGAESDRVQGLKLGADDYVLKPFSVKELLARVQAVLRRSPQRPVDVQHVPFPQGVADLQRLEIRFRDGEHRDLSQREADLLRYLALHAGRPIAREELLANVWRIDPGGVETRTIDMHVARLREKLRDDPHDPGVVVTVRGKGYMLASAPGETRA